MASAPGLKEKFVGELVDKAKIGLNLNVVRYVDDLRAANSVILQDNEDRDLLNVQLECFKDNLE